MLESFEKQKINSWEKRESNYENKENEISEELKAAAKMERVDFLTKEIKSGNQQIKNIMIHMTQVLNAIKILRQQLQLKDENKEKDSISVDQDKKQIEKIKKKLSSYKDEIIKMKDDLIKIEINNLKEGKNKNIDIKKEAEKNINEILKIIEE